MWVALHTRPVLQSMALLMLANGPPVVAEKILCDRFAFPLDAGLTFLERRSLLGSSKTIRGLLLSILITAAWVRRPSLVFDPRHACIRG